MFLNWILPIMGAIWGVATSAGIFALLIKLGVVPRMVARCHLAEHALACENAIMLGTVAGGLLSLGEGDVWIGNLLPQSLGLQPGAHWLALLFICLLGLGAGIFVGCQAMALAEILNMFPILFRRLKLREGLGIMITALALGKMAGSLWYFIFSYQNM